MMKSSSKEYRRAYRRRWQHDNHNKQRLYEDRSHAKHLISSDRNGKQTKWLLKLIANKLTALDVSYVKLPASIVNRIGTK